MARKLAGISLIYVCSISFLYAQTADGDALCKEMGNLAEQIMAIRQTDFPVSSAIEKLVDDQQDKLAAKIIRSMILSAYEIPAFSSEGMQKKSVARFRNDIETECYSKAF